MTPQETAGVTVLVQAVCPAQHFDDDATKIWHELLGDLRAEDCVLAVKRLGQRQEFIPPKDIRAEVKRIRAERLDATLVPDPPPEVETTAQYMAWLRRTRREIADGTYEPPPQIEARPQDVRGLIEGAFRSAS